MSMPCWDRCQFAPSAAASKMVGWRSKATRVLGLAWTDACASAGMTLAAGPTASEIIQVTGVSAGLAVVVGTTDGALEGGLTNGGKMLVQGLALSDEAAAKARLHLFEQKLYGLASVAQVQTAKTLPYYDRIVNLLVADLDGVGNDAPPMEEIQRVLGYEGVAYLKKGGKWAKTIKPTPKEVDSWGHFGHDASGNAVSHDLLVGPPNALRWNGGPFGRNLIGGMRTSNGIAVQINPTYNERLMNKSAVKGGVPDNLRGLLLWARDVNSGVLLWNRKIAEGGGDKDYALFSGYVKTFVAAEGRVFGFDFTAEDRIALTAWNLSSGAVERVYDKAAVCRKEDAPDIAPTGERGYGGAQPDWRTWARDTFARTTVLAHQGKVVHALRDRLFVMDAATGEVLWRKEPAKGTLFLNAVIAGDRLVAVVGKLEGYQEQVPRWSNLRSAFPLDALEAWQWRMGFISIA